MNAKDKATLAAFIKLIEGIQDVKGCDIGDALELACKMFLELRLKELLGK